MPPDIHLHRTHTLGLPRARQVAESWAEQARQTFGMACHWGEDERANTLEFTRQGVSGQLAVSATHFELGAKLGFLLRAFAPKIEAEIRKNLDALLDGPAAPAAPGPAAAGPAKTSGSR